MCSSMGNIKKTDTFFVISNYNTDPELYTEYCNDYHIYDQSPDQEIVSLLREKYQNISFVKNTGHNISDYFTFFIDNYDNLPDFILLGKGNMIGRHLDQEFFDRVYRNKKYTMLYNDRNNIDKKGLSYQLYDGAFLEINNNWFIESREHRYFHSYNSLLRFLFIDPIFPQWILFSPGSCYIVSKEQVTKYPIDFYKSLHYLISYTYFPSEAYLVERMLHVIYSGIYDINRYMYRYDDFLKKLNNLPEYQKKKESYFDKIKYFLKTKI